MNEALLIAKENHKIARAQVKRDIALALINNPVIEILVLYVAVETLQKRKILPDAAGNVAEGAGLVAIGLQQIAPMMPYIMAGGKNVTSAAGDIAGKMALSNVAGLL